MNIALGIRPDTENKPLVVMEIYEPNVSLAVAITNEDNYEKDIDTLVDGLIQIKADMRRAKSGLTVVQEVPDALRQAQQGKEQRRPRSPRK